jgi:hypothetical protein
VSQAVGLDAASRQAPAWVLGLLITTATFGFWGALVALRGLVLAAGEDGLTAGDPRFGAALLLFGVAAASMAMVASLGIRGLRAGRLRPALGTQLTLGAMLTLAVVIDVLNAGHAAGIRTVYEHLPALTLLTAYSVQAVFAALSFALLTSTRPRAADAVLGLAAVGALVALAGAILALIPAFVAGIGIVDALQWGGAIPAALVAADVVIAAGVYRARH